LAWKGSFCIIKEELDGCCVSDEFPIFQIDSSIAIPKFLEYYFQTDRIREQAAEILSRVSAASRFRLYERDFLRLKIPLTQLDEQQES